DERAIFFCKGVLETVKKLGWAPDIIHCHDWFTSFIPLYLKTTYRNVPTFKDTKCIFTAYDTPFEHQFDKSIAEKVKMPDIDDDMLTPIAKGTYSAFIELGARYADRFTLAHTAVEKHLSDANLIAKGEVVERSESFMTYYHELYHELLGISVGELV
ncbi:MAG: glycogen/starch synthase, partial [Flammeovirgaceae bacterium]|nr:glycogen/starch synthase [Flammeovirgaceae bacterium]MDW8287862.1 glycogen/starch synthase [Flammeovirgaceae bacterium]